MIRKIRKWGNSLGLRVPKVLAEEMGMTEDSTVDLKLEKKGLVVRVLPADRKELEDLLAGVNAENLHGETETGDPVGGEVW